MLASTSAPLKGTRGRSMLFASEGQHMREVYDIGLEGRRETLMKEQRLDRIVLLNVIDKPGKLSFTEFYITCSRDNG